MTKDQLTIVIPARDHPQRVASQLRLLAAADIMCPVVIAYSSGAEHAPEMRAVARRHGAVCRHSDPATPLFDKLHGVVATIDTPFVLVSPDRKVTLPHAIFEALHHLTRHQDTAAALGHVLGFAHQDDVIDVNRVVYFTPTIGEDEPLRRLHHLMRRYQSSIWAIFRKEAFLKSAAAARSIAGPMFQEVLFMATMVLQGKLARLPLIFRVEADEQSKTPLKQLDPLYWFLDDSRSFLAHYLHYRKALADFIAAEGIDMPGAVELGQLLDTVHAIWLRYSLDGGVLNHAARLFLGEDASPLPNLQGRPPWRDEVEPGDIVRQGRLRVIWRRAVLQAEPRHEIAISPGEMEQAERQLALYFDR